MTEEIELEFRVAAPDDADAVIAMMRALEMDDPNKRPFDEEQRRVAYQELIREPRFGRIWLIAKDHETVGYAVLAYVFSFEYAGRNAFLDELYVAPEYRGKGFGRRAVAFVEEVAAREKLGALHLEVSPRNTRALRLYSGSGFANHDRYLLTKWLNAGQLG